MHVGCIFLVDTVQRLQHTIQDDPKYAYGLRISDSEKRLRYFVHLCQVRGWRRANGDRGRG